MCTLVYMCIKCFSSLLAPWVLKLDEWQQKISTRGPSSPASQPRTSPCAAHTSRLLARREISSQNEGISKHSSPPFTTTAKITTKLQNNFTQNHQKIKLYESLMTKELKKLHSSIQVGGRETQDMKMQNGQSKTYVWQLKIGRDTSGARDPSPMPDHSAQGSSARRYVPITSGCKNQWGLGQ